MDVRPFPCLRLKEWNETRHRFVAHERRLMAQRAKRSVCIYVRVCVCVCVSRVNERGRGAKIQEIQ